MQTISINSTSQIRRELLKFIDEKAFDAILRLPPETYSGKDREKFETVIEKTLEDKKKFHAYRTPEEIKVKFLNEACADGLKKDKHDLHYLNNLSALPEMKEEFIDLCKKLGV